MNEAQITLVFMMLAIAVTGALLHRQGALGWKSLAVVLGITAIVGGFMLWTL